MSVAVRPVDLDSEQHLLIGFLQKHLTAVSHHERFEWLYRNNPAGAAWSWFVYERETGEIVGAASLFPRMMWVGKDIKRCGQVGDFAVDMKYRSLGPALLLQRATFEPVRQGSLEFCYDCPPHALGMATFRRLGLEANCRMATYVRVLKADRQVSRYLGNGGAARAVSALANSVLALTTRRWTSARGVHIAAHVGRFDEEFTELDRATRDGASIRGRRSAEDLNWRYRDDPLNQYHVLTARRGGELEAYLVLDRRGEDSYVIDLAGTHSCETVLELLQAAADCSRQSSAHTLRLILAESFRSRGFLHRAQFVYRENAINVVAYIEPSNLLFPLLRNPDNWVLNYVDVSA